MISSYRCGTVTERLRPVAEYKLLAVALHFEKEPQNMPMEEPKDDGFATRVQIVPGLGTEKHRMVKFLSACVA